jgi:hypothetical protein
VDDIDTRTAGIAVTMGSLFSFAKKEEAPGTATKGGQKVEGADSADTAGAKAIGAEQNTNKQPVERADTATADKTGGARKSGGREPVKEDKVAFGAGCYWGKCAEGQTPNAG